MDLLAANFEARPGLRRPEDDRVAISRRLRELRLAHGYRKRPEWAEFLDVKLAALGHYEDGIRRPSIEAALQYCDRTGVSLDWIFRGREDGLPRRVLDKLDAYRKGHPTPQSDKRA